MQFLPLVVTVLGDQYGTVVLEPMTYVTNVVFETSLSKHMFIRVCLENITKAVGGGCFCYDVFFSAWLVTHPPEFGI